MLTAEQKNNINGVYNVEWMQPITSTPINKKGRFKMQQRNFTSQLEAVEFFLKLEADPETQYCVTTDPSTLGFRSNHEMEMFVRGEIERSSEYYRSLED